jgi:hypothetical protein
VADVDQPFAASMSETLPDLVRQTKNNHESHSVPSDGSIRYLALWSCTKKLVAHAVPIDLRALEAFEGSPLAETTQKRSRTRDEPRLGRVVTYGLFFDYCGYSADRATG